MKICKHDASCLSSAVRGARNGIYYGANIRFMHALVMTFLFKKVFYYILGNFKRENCTYNQTYL